MTDRLTLARALEEGGITRDAAEHIATEIFDAIHDHVATKADVQAVRADLQALESRVLLRFSELEHRLTLRFGSVMVVLTGIILTAIRYLPHN